MRTRCNEAKLSIKMKLSAQKMPLQYIVSEIELFCQSGCPRWHSTCEQRFSGSDLLDFQICYSAKESKFTMLGSLKRYSRNEGEVPKCDIQTSVCVKHSFRQDLVAQRGHRPWIFLVTKTDGLIMMVMMTRMQ